jgi:hypothetical protein
VDGVSVGAHGGYDDFTVIVLKSGGFANRSCSALDSLLVDTSGIVNSKSDILHTITVLGNVIREFFGVFSQGRLKSINDVTIANNVDASVAVASLETLKD